VHSCLGTAAEPDGDEAAHGGEDDRMLDSKPDHKLQ